MNERWERRAKKLEAIATRVRKHGQFGAVMNAIAKRAEEVSENHQNHQRKDNHSKGHR